MSTWLHLEHNVIINKKKAQCRFDVLKNSLPASALLGPTRGDLVPSWHSWGRSAGTWSPAGTPGDDPRGLGPQLWAPGDDPRGLGPQLGPPGTIRGDLVPSWGGVQGRSAGTWSPAGPPGTIHGDLVPSWAPPGDGPRGLRPQLSPSRGEPYLLDIYNHHKNHKNT